MSILNFNIEDQALSLWCWAAVSNSILLFYSPGSNSRQCTIADGVFPGRGPCCPAQSNCNDIANLNDALQVAGIFASKTGRTTWTKVQNEGSNGLALGARIAPSGGGGHFVVIYGASISQGRKYFHIDDPKEGVGKSFITFTDFKTKYQGDGVWTNTFFTKKNPSNAL